jgi:hypothetical protein
VLSFGKNPKVFSKTTKKLKGKKAKKSVTEN